MRPSLVRLTENKEIVGIFCASSLVELGEMIDQCCDPRQCEYLPIKSGGIYWPKPNAPTLPFPENEDGFDFTGVTLANWDVDLLNKMAKWRPVTKMPDWVRSINDHQSTSPLKWLVTDADKTTH